MVTLASKLEKLQSGKKHFVVDRVKTSLVAQSKFNLNIFILRIPTNQRAQWSQECHKNEMYLSVHLTNWAIIYPEKLKNDVKQFVGVMQDAARGMRYNISNPK